MKEIRKDKGIKKFHIQKKHIIVIAVFGLCAFTSVLVWAKFIRERRTEATLEGKNIATYYMDVLGDDNSSSLSQKILVEEMNPGEYRTVDFYVRNGNEDMVSQVDMDYEIEIIHTDNMPLIYELYDEEGNKLAGVSNESGEEKYINDGNRVKYTQAGDGSKLVLKIDKSDDTKIDSDKYTLKVIWNKDDESANFKYVKEIEILYVNVNAYQSNPLKN